MYSIYHFFKNINDKRRYLKLAESFKYFPFDTSLFSFVNRTTFPDMIIRLNKDNTVFTGGEFIELKDSRSYTMLSFNSAIPTGKKEIKRIINSHIKKHIEEKGEDINSLTERDVFYLIRGKKNRNVKTCLIHGSFFETVKINYLISQSFYEYANELNDTNTNRKLRLCLLELFENAKVRKPNINNASVKLRFIPEVEVKAEGNILNPKKYPEMKDDTLNFILPCHNDEDGKNILRKAEIVFGKSELKQFKIFKIKHHFNGYFLALQTSI